MNEPMTEEQMRQVVDDALEASGLPRGEDHMYLETERPVLRWSVRMSPELSVQFHVSDYFSRFPKILGDSVKLIAERWSDKPGTRHVDPVGEEWDEFAAGNMELYMERNSLRPYEAVESALTPAKLELLKSKLGRDYSKLTVCWTDEDCPWHSTPMRLVALPRLYAGDSPGLIRLMAEELTYMRLVFKEASA